tara:strand:+ start:202 stop:984 length:783 start_codon:yes stop_codon:yes gene_type:complete
MIRNYYTEAFKGGIVIPNPLVAGQLIDGTVKITETIAVPVHPLNAATSVTILLATVFPNIKRGMYITAPAAGGSAAWTINDHIMVEAVSSTTTNTTITLNKPFAIAANTGMTIFSIAQSSWKEYSLYIGTSPVQQNNFGSITSGTANAALAAQNTITIKVSNPYVQEGMAVYDDGVLIGTIAVGGITNSTTFVLAVALGAPVVDASVLTFSYLVLPSVSVLTVDNQTVTFTSPAEGFVLPVAVVQVTAVAGGISNLIALE